MTSTGSSNNHNDVIWIVYNFLSMTFIHSRLYFMLMLGHLTFVIGEKNEDFNELELILAQNPHACSIVLVGLEIVHRYVLQS